MFRTEFNIPPSTPAIPIAGQVFSAGSCFADCMGTRLHQFKFNVLANPFGILFNPFSISKLLRLALNGENLDKNGLLRRGERHFHYDLHSEVSAGSADELLSLGNSLLRQTSEHLHTASHVIITMGTAYVYRQISSDSLVANCHKMPSQEFAKEMLKPQDIAEDYTNLIDEFRTRNLNPAFIFTVSPVRHIKDTIPMNAVSKAALRLAVHEITLKNENAHYFPSYEVMMDDLRDYRFYKSDMLHPTETAEDYIWEKFTRAWMDEGTRLFIKEWGNLSKSLKHRPLQPGSDEHKVFVSKTIERLNSFKDKVDITEELEHIQAQIL